MNKGGKYVGEFVPELVDRYAHFRGFFPVITGFLKPRLTCNRFYFVNPADHCDRPPILPVEPGHFTRRAYIVCVAQMRSRAVAARAWGHGSTVLTAGYPRMVGRWSIPRQSAEADRLNSVGVRRALSDRWSLFVGR
jgi:hypothetical protein